MVIVAFSSSSVTTMQPTERALGHFILACGSQPNVTLDLKNRFDSIWFVPMQDSRIGLNHGGENERARASSFATASGVAGCLQTTPPTVMC